MLRAFLQLLFGSFFRAWWTFLTGFVGILAFVLSPTTITLSQTQFALSVIVTSIFLFLTISTVYQGWLLYSNRIGVPRLSGIQRSDIYGGEYIFLITGMDAASHGRVVELKRLANGVEIAFALVELIEQNAQGQFQGRPVWIAPGHLRDLRQGQFTISDVTCEPIVHLRTIISARQELVVRG
jgi:signal transduction histidine kinase